MRSFIRKSLIGILLIMVSCGIAYGQIGFGSQSSNLVFNDARYVNVPTDTMTGLLTLSVGAAEALRLSTNATDYTKFTLDANGGLAIESIDDAAAAADVSITADGTFAVTSTGFNLSGAGALSGVTTLGLSGAITGATATDTINGVVINSSAISSVTTLGLTGAISGATATDTINGMIINSGAVSGVTTLSMNNELDMTGASAIIDLNPAQTATANIIDITPTAVLGTEDAVWKAINIDATALDPSAANTDIAGMRIDLSGVSLTNLPHLDGLELETPAAGAGLEHHAIHISEGTVLHNFDSGTAAGSVYEVYEIEINAANQDANSDTHAFDVVVEGALAGEVVALHTGANVKPIKQAIETFSVPDQTGSDSFAGRYTGSYTAGIDTNEIFVADDDEIWIGNTGTFDELQVLMTTPATKDIAATFWYYNTSQAWIEFFPTDGTEGFQSSGNLIWNSAGFTNWGATEDPAAGNGSAGYWMKIKRTKNADPGTVTPATIKLASAISIYQWDASLSPSSIIVGRTIHVQDRRYGIGSSNGNISSPPRLTHTQNWYHGWLPRAIAGLFSLAQRGNQKT